MHSNNEAQDTQGMAACEVFDATVLSQLNFSKSRASYKNGVSPQHLPADYVLRPLLRTDFSHDYCQLLAHLTKVGHVSKDMFEKQFDLMRSSGVHMVLVFYHSPSASVVGSATLLLEHKFIHTTATRGRIEDVIVHPNHQGKQLGTLLLDVLILLAESKNCYKLSLDCNDKAMPFYEKLSLEHQRSQRFMCIKFFD